MSIRDDLIALKLASQVYLHMDPAGGGESYTAIGVRTNEEAADILLASDAYKEIGREAILDYVDELRKLSNQRYNWTVQDWINDLTEWANEIA